MQASFDSLVKNALDFMENSIKDLKSNPKYSVINFYTAIELFLKSRLLHEHWSLVVQKPECAKKDNFIQGDFQSVGLNDTVARLKNICKQNISAKEIKCFSSIAEHRNRMVHFFNPDYLPNPKTTAIQEIVISQCRAWFFLHRLLVERWGNIYKDYFSGINNITKLMHDHQEYLEAKCNELCQQIEIEREKGNTIIKCFACEFEAAIENEIIEPLFKQSCLVCETDTNYLKIDCSECGEEILTSDPVADKCPHCSAEIDIDSLVNEYSDGCKPDEADYIHTTACCSECNGYETVAKINDNWVCFSCLAVFDNVDDCERCGRSIAGDIGDTIMTGCDFCN